MNKEKRITKQEALKCSMVGFRTLVLNVCITHLQRVKEYQKTGKFDIKLFEEQFEFLSAWKDKSQFFKRANARTYRRYATTFNYAFKYDSKLIDKLMCGYLDDNGKYRRTSVREVVKELCDIGFLDATKLLKRGAKFKKGEDGSYTKEYDWTNKYFMANRKQWYSMLKLDAYRNWNTYPKDKFDDECESYKNRAIRIISSYYAKYKSEAKPTQEVEKPEPVAKGWREVVGKFKAHNIEDMIHEVETGRDGGGALQNVLASYKLDAKICDEIEREAHRRAREWKAKRLEMMKQQTPTHEFNDKEKGIIREIASRLMNDKVNEAQAAYVWKTVGATEEEIQKWLKAFKEKKEEKKAEKEAQRLRELNAIAEAKAEKKPEPPKVLNEEQMDEFLNYMKQLEERK